MENTSRRWIFKLSFPETTRTEIVQELKALLSSYPGSHHRFRGNKLEVNNSLQAAFMIKLRYYDNIVSVQ